MRVNRTVTSNRSVLVEVLWNREPHKDSESQNELSPEAIKIAKLKETEADSTCLGIQSKLIV